MVASSEHHARFPTITNQLYQLAAGTVTSDHLVRRSLDAIDASQSTLNAFRVVLRERALADGTLPVRGDRKHAPALLGRGRRRRVVMPFLFGLLVGATVLIVAALLFGS